jgi:hypothetical protein
MDVNGFGMFKEKNESPCYGIIMGRNDSEELFIGRNLQVLERNFSCIYMQ